MEWDFPPRVCINFHAPYMTRINKWKMQKAVCCIPSQLSVLIMLDMAVIHGTISHSVWAYTWKIERLCYGWSRITQFTDWTTEGLELRVPIGPRIFYSAHRSDRIWGPRSLISSGCRGLFFPGGCSSPPTSAEVKKTWIYTSTPPCAFVA
jgi:hypothetical protein